VHESGLFYYTGYGLGICSNLELPELLGGDRTVDIGIFTAHAKSIKLIPPASTSTYVSSREAWLIFKDIGTVLVRNGNEILIETIPGADPKVIRLCILGPALAILLHQREFLVLHASSIEIRTGAIAFLGWSGWGKSTIAGAMHDRGFAVVADDFIAISTASKTNLIVSPGFPRLKLWPDAAIALGRDLGTLPRLHSHADKREVLTRGGFVRTPLALRKLYVLADAPDLTISPLTPQQSVAELIRHTYGVTLLRNMRSSDHLKQYAIVVDSIPICRLTSPRDLRLLSDLAQMVELDSLRA
jgi:hypothetical protein